jgi:glycosyltransferase involved in cell wall biosynthesis
MKAVMIFPNRDSEKAISGYSKTLTDNIRKIDFKIDDLNYTAGKPFSLFKQIKKIRSYDVIHIQHEYNMLGWYGIPFFILYFLLIFSKAKKITTMHTALSLKENFKGSKLKTIFRKILYITQNRIINWCNDEVIVHANFFKDILIKEYGFRQEKIIILPQAIIEHKKLPEKQEARKKLKLKGKIYLIIGGFVPDHGADIIIKKAKEIGPTILIVANPNAVNDRNKKRIQDYLNENIEYVRKNKLEKYTRFDVFNINDKSPLWWEYFCAADLVLLPYRGGIGSGIFAHSIAAKTPIIASNIQFFNEISNNFNCLKVVKDEKDYPNIIKEASKEENLKKMKKECQKYFNKYKVSRISKEYIKIYKRT